jgi:DNA repair protein RadC
VKYLREVNVIYGKSKTSPIKVKQASCVVDFIRTKILKNNSKEHFILLCLNGSHEIIAYNIVSIGTATQTLAHPREVFQPALIAGAIKIIVAHNHPSNSTQPSKEDHNVTEQLKRIGELLSIPLLDHVIVTDDSYFSFLENGHL